MMKEAKHTEIKGLKDELAALKNEGRYQSLKIWETGSGTWMRLNGRKVLQMCSNNYLGLTNHPELKQAATEAIAKYGVGCGSVRTIVGTQDIHERLENELARFKNTEAALVFQSGFTANLGILSSILGGEDAVISDELNHASIIDGIRLTKAKRKIFKHKDMDQLEKALKENADCRRKVVVTDGVFSMDGDIAPLPDIVALCERYDAIVYVDDAHASGVLGKNGKGSADYFGLRGRVHIQVGTLSKAIGAAGGYMAGSQSLKDVLIHKARPFLFSTSQPPSVAATCLAAIRLLSSSQHLIDRLWNNTTYFRDRLKRIGFDTGISETPIVPVIIGDPTRTSRFSDELLEEGVCATGIVYPTVAMDKGRIRMIVTASHTTEDLDFALDRLTKVGRRFGLV